jgi:hypothetical protein
MFRGKQWFTDRPDFRSSEVINLIFQLIQSQVPIMTDSRPTIVFLPTEPSDQPFAELLTKIFDFDWETNSWDEELLEIIYDANFYGLGIGTIDFDAKANNNLGSMVFSSFDPFYFIPDPNAKDCNKDAQWIITAVPTDVECVKRDYPEKAPFIKADIGNFWENEKTDIGHLKFRSPTDSNVLLEGSATSDDWSRNKTLVVTLYIKDSEVIEEEISKENIGGEQPIDVAYTILALSTFYDAFKDEKYLKKMKIAFDWFLGKNHLNHIIYNPCTGGCYDGLEEDYINLNQGAESTVSYLMARLTLEKYFNTSNDRIHKTSKRVLKKPLKSNKQLKHISL